MPENSCHTRVLIIGAMTPADRLWVLTYLLAMRPEAFDLAVAALAGTRAREALAES